MLRKVIDEFDIDPTGWFDLPTDASNPQVDHYTRPATNLWSLWVKNPIEVLFVTEDTISNQSLVSLARSISRAFTHKGDCCKPIRRLTDDEFISLLIQAHAYRNNTFTLDCSVVSDLERDIESTYLNIREKHTPCVYLPNYFINPQFAGDVGDYYLLTDGMTGYGLEAMETISFVLPTLGRIGISNLIQIHDKSLIPDTTDGLRHPDAIRAECALDIWWALQVRDIRSRILTQWPGWSDIFNAQDSLLLPAVETMQNHVSKKSPQRSELRRFCIAMTWNLNPQATRLKFPRGTDNAYNAAVSAWSTILSTPETDGARLVAIHNFISSLNLDTEERRMRTDRGGQSGIDNGNLDGKPTRKSRMNRNRHGIFVEPSSNDTKNKDEGIVPGIIAPCGDWNRLLNSSHPDHQMDAHHARDYRATSIKFQSEYRARIADQISGSAWFVPNPPPLEHGNLDGVLDEGNLLRYAAFSDPNIFSVRPDAGNGQIVIGILVDGSGSMGATLRGPDGKPLPNLPTCMHGAMCFLAGVRDGLTRNSNIKVEAFSFDSRLKLESDNSNHPLNITLPLPPTMSEHLCVLRRLDTEDDMLNNKPGGGTPISCAIHTLNQHLECNYPDAHRIMLILTDGDPQALCQHPDYPDRTHHDDTNEVRKIVSSISTPVFCVGINVDASALQAQYNVGHWFVVDSPLKAADVAADLVRGIGQSLNCC